jgi:hypothetical protein
MNVTEGMRRRLQQRRRGDALKLKILRGQIMAGVADLERGHFIEIDDDDLEWFLERLPPDSDKDAD